MKRTLFAETIVSTMSEFSVHGILCSLVSVIHLSSIKARSSTLNGPAQDINAVHIRTSPTSLQFQPSDILLVHLIMLFNIIKRKIIIEQFYYLLNSENDYPVSILAKSFCQSETQSNNRRSKIRLVMQSSEHLRGVITIYFLQNLTCFVLFNFFLGMRYNEDKSIRINSHET